MSRRATRRSLPARLLAFVVLPLALVLSAGAYIVLHALEREFERMMEDEVEMVARALQEVISRAMEREDHVDIGRALESALDIGRVYGAYVYDERGELFAASGTLVSRMDDGERLPELMEDGRRTGEYGRVGGEPVYSYFVPLTGEAGQVLGLLEVTRRERDIGQYTEALRTRAIVVLGLALSAVTVIVLVGYYGAAGRSLGRLRASMERVEGGEREHRAATRGPGEIATVAGSLNAMLDAIARAEDDVRREREERSDLERKLQHSEKLAALGRLAAGVAHELGTPLSVIDGKAQRALRDEALSPDVRAVLGTTREQVARMDGIVRQLLDFARPGRRERGDVEASELARAAAAAVGEELSQREVSLELRGGGGRVVRVDRARAERALINLLKNAAQAARSQVRLTVADAGAGEGAAVFRVEDDGDGLPEGVSETALFEPFFTTKGPDDGTGLGLSVAHTVAEEHGTYLSARASAKLRGACFELALPLSASDERGEGTTT